MNMNMFSPEMMNNMKNMIDGKSMKNMLGNIANMSDDQIRMYLNASGMGHMSPQTFRQMAGQFKNMDESELERMKNIAPNMPPRGFPSNQPSSQANNSSTIKTETKPQKNNSSTSMIDSNLHSTGATQPKNVVETLEKIKIEGNNFFRLGKYKEACEKYYEILNEMEYVSDSDKTKYHKQLDDIESICRLNIANTKLKQEDYDLVIHECLKVLKKSENYKAHYRAGIAFYKKGSHMKAFNHLTKAKELNKDSDAEVDRYLKECKKFVDEIEEDKKKSQTLIDNKKETEEVKGKQTLEVSKNESYNINQNIKDDVKQSDERTNIQEAFIEKEDVKYKTSTNSQENINTNKNNPELIKPSSKIEKLKEVVEKEVKTESISNDKPQKDDILIEENQGQKSNSTYSQQNFNPGFMPNYPPNMNERMSQMQRELENMDESQFGGMISMLRSMDNATIKSMMAMQGMNLSEEQIEMMKNVDPSMLNNVKKSRMNLNQNNMDSNFSANGSAVTNTSPPTINQSTPNAFPNLNNMDFNSMLKMIQDNPQLMNMMGPQMANMFGGSGANQQAIMNSMQSILWLLSLPQKIKSFFSSTRGMLFIAFIFILIIAYFYNR